MEVCVYSGSGAVLADDVKTALKRLSISHLSVNENLIRDGKLRSGFKVLIIPGGYTATIASTLRGKGFNEIRSFISEGGTYIGICAGAYIAAERVEVPGRPKGLGVINVSNVRISGMGLVKMFIVKPNHPVVKRCPKVMKIWYQNGPYMLPGEDVDMVARYGEGYAAIVCSSYGSGRVILFSPHPEGNLKHGVDPERLGTIRLLENSVKWGLSDAKL